MSINNFKKSCPIGHDYKKENVFMATLVLTPEETMEKVAKEYSAEEGAFAGLLASLGYPAAQYHCMVYKDSEGYIVFEKDQNRHLKGDNSDHKGELKYIESAWDYYDEGQVGEAEVDGRRVLIVLTSEPLLRYKQKCLAQDAAREAGLREFYRPRKMEKLTND